MPYVQQFYKYRYWINIGIMEWPLKVTQGHQYLTHGMRFIIGGQ